MHNIESEHEETAGISPHDTHTCMTCGQPIIYKEYHCKKCSDHGHFMIGLISALLCPNCDAYKRAPLPQNAGDDVQWIFHYTIPENELLKKGDSLYALPVTEFDRGKNPPPWGSL